MNGEEVEEGERGEQQSSSPATETTEAPIIDDEGKLLKKCDNSALKWNGQIMTNYLKCSSFPILFFRMAEEDAFVQNPSSPLSNGVSSELHEETFKISK